MHRGRGFILLMVLVLLALLAANLLWSAGLQVQAMKQLTMAISRLQLEAAHDRKLTEIREVLSKNASLWFNQGCAAGYCTVPWGERGAEALNIERLLDQNTVWLLVSMAEERELLLRCTEWGCEPWSYRKG